METLIIVLIVIIVLVYLGQKVFLNEEFKIADSLKLYIFLSPKKKCNRCQMYLNNDNDKVNMLAKNRGIEVKIVQSDGSAKSNDLFDKFDIKSVPTIIIVKNNKIYRKFGYSSDIYDVLQSALDKLNPKITSNKNL
jgi:hypothetical protein